MPSICRIHIYPLKAFAPIQVSEVRILPNGALEHDRQFALVDDEGQYINSKRTGDVHKIQVVLDPHARLLTVRRRDQALATTFELDSQRTELQHWFSDYFAMPVTLVENTGGGFPDDTKASGPTIVSTSSLQTVADWFPSLAVEQVRMRFRANLEIANVAPFWEDGLFNSAGQGDRPFRVGGVVFGGSNPCERCIVPTRDPETGDVWHGFSKRFRQLREANLPAWAAADRFDHFYRLTVNTRLISAGSGVVRLGDHIELVT